MADSLTELHGLATDLDHWVCLRKKADPLGQYHTQLTTVQTLLTTAADTLAPDFEKIPAAPAAATFAACDRFDRRVIWLRRVWRFFRDRFDQRDDTQAADTLRAADEIVWSCYSQPFAQMAALGLPSSPGPVPLPFIDPVFAPEIFPTDLVPIGLRTDVDPAFLRQVLDSLPMAVVRLPPASIRAPWWLILLAHEVGHAVDTMLLGRKAHRAVLEPFGLDDTQTDRWEWWAAELFADLYAILTIGPWFVWTLAGLEVGDEAHLAARRERYPSPAARLLIARHACQELGLTLPDLVQGLPLDQVEACEVTVARDADVGRRLVDGWLVTKIKGFTWRDLTAFNAEDWAANGPVKRWRTHLLGTQALPAPEAPAKKLARIVAAAGVAAWTERREGASAEARTALADRLRAALFRVREGGARAVTSAPSTDAAGAALGNAIRGLSDPRLDS